MNINDATKILTNSYGEHLEKVYIPSLERYVMFKPLTTAHVKMLTRNSFIDNFQLSVEILKLSLFDTLCAEDLSKENISSKNITIYDYLSFLIGIKQMLNIELIHNFTCSCTPDTPFEKKLVLDELFDDIISDFKKQNEIFEKVDEVTGIIYKFELVNFTMLDYLYYKHILNKIKENNDSNIELKETEKYLRPLLYIKNVFINDEKIDDWNNLLITDKLKFFNNISPKVIISDNKNETLISFIEKTFAEEKLIKFIKDIEVECPKCNKKYRGVYDLDNFFTF